MSWTSIECSFVLPDEGEDLLFTIDTDSWGYEAAMVVTDPDGVSTTYNGSQQWSRSDSDNRLSRCWRLER